MTGPIFVSTFATLLANIIGTMVVYFYGLPSNIRDPKEGDIFVVATPTEEQQRTIRRTNLKLKVKSYLGLTFILIGFLIQFIASFE